MGEEKKKWMYRKKGSKTYHWTYDQHTLAEFQEMMRQRPEYEGLDNMGNALLGIGVSFDKKRRALLLNAKGI